MLQWNVTIFIVAATYLHLRLEQKELHAAIDGCILHASHHPDT